MQAHAQFYIDNAEQIMRQRALDEGDICFGAKAVENLLACANPYGQFNNTFAQFAGLGSDPISNSLNGTECNVYYPAMQNENIGVNCMLGLTNSNQQSIVAIGDSHLFQYTKTLDIAAQQLDVSLISLVTTCCLGGVRITDTWLSSLPMPQASINYCNMRYNITQQYLDNADVIIQAGRISPDDTIFQAYITGIELLIDYANAASKTIIIVEDIPPIGSIGCLYSSSTSCSEPKSAALARNHRFFNQLKSDGYDNKYVLLNTQQYFCDTTNCHNFVGQISAYYDTEHLTGSFALTLANSFAAQLRKFI